ncbi:MAG: hypothetical protein WD889_01410 [Candidatus Colwellbacteria bacterium]
MNQDFSELVEYLDKKFASSDTKQEEIKQEVGQLQVTVAVLHEDVREIGKDLTELQATVRDLVTAIDKLAKVIDDLHTEYSAMAMQLSRHEKWIQQLAEKLGVKLEI